MSPLPLWILAASGAGSAEAYELIESSILTSSASSITFSSIPQDYKHLQLRAVTRQDGAVVYGNALLSLNGTSPSYWHYLYTYNTSIYSGGYGSPYGNYGFWATGNNAATGVFAPTVMDILDYSSSSKNTTLKYLTGYNDSNSGVALMSNLWSNTTAVTSLTIAGTSNYVAGSRFSLYGIRG